MAGPLVYVDHSDVHDGAVETVREAISIEVYGEPSERAIEQLRAKAQMLGTGEVSIHRPAGGFTRF